MIHDPAGPPARRGLQPRRPVVRADLVRPAGAHRRDHRPRRHPPARRHPHRRPGHPLLPGVSSSEMFGKVRRGAPDARRRPFYPRSPYGVAKVYGHWITVNYRETLRPARHLAASSSTTRAPAAASSSSPARSPTASPGSSSAWTTELRLGNLDAQRDWGFAGDYVEAMWLHAPAGRARRLRRRHRRDALGARVLRGGLRPRRPRLGGPRRASTSSSCAPPRSTCWSATRAKARDGARLEAHDVASPSWSRMMVDADLELLAGQQRNLTSADRHRLAGGVGAARLLAGLVQVVDPADAHRDRQRRRRRRAARAAHQPRPRHRHLHPRRRHQPRDRAGACAGETWQAMDDARALRRRRPGSASATATSAPTSTAPSACRGRHADRGHRRDRRGVGPRACACCP